MAEINSDSDHYIKLLLDSGVFSAWSHKQKLTIDEYIDYVKFHKQYLFAYVNMDSVPDASSKSGGFPTYQETERSAKSSYNNQQKMKEHGLSPIPVFHQGESFEWLERYLNDGEDYIGISPWKTNITTKQQQEWFDDVFSFLTDSKGRPVVKTHGFGVASPKFMMRYPWYSLDSTTWVLSAGFGKIFVPKYRNDEPDYLRLPINVIVSGRESVSKSANKMQFENLGPLMQNYVLRFLNEDVNVTISEARNIPEARRAACLIYFKKLCEHLEDIRFYHHKKGLLSKFDINHNRKAVKEKWCAKYFCATNLSRKFSFVMNNCDAQFRLLSYFELRDKPDEYLTQYVTKGIVGDEYEYKSPPASWNLEAYHVHRYKGFLKRSEIIDDKPQGIS